MHKNEKQYKRDLSRRKLVHSILIRVQGLFKLDQNNLNDSQESIDPKQQNLLSFFKFK